MLRFPDVICSPLEFNNTTGAAVVIRPPLRVTSLENDVLAATIKLPLPFTVTMGLKVDKEAIVTLPDDKVRNTPDPNDTKLENANTLAPET